MVSIALLPCRPNPPPTVYHPDELTYYDTEPCETEQWLFLDFYPGILGLLPGDTHRIVYTRWYQSTVNHEENKKLCPVRNGMIPLLDYFPAPPNHHDSMVAALPYELPDDCLNIIKAYVECRELYDHVMLDLMGLCDE